MIRVRLAYACVLVLNASALDGAFAAETSTATPRFACPNTQLGDDDIQRQYDKMWARFTAEVESATRSLETEIDSRFAAAQRAGHLDLALMWDGMKKQFSQASTLRWDSAKEEKTWQQRFGDVAFPDDFALLIQKCDDSYTQAREHLRDGYKSIESALTKTSLERAQEVRAEFRTLLEGESTAKPKPVPDSVSKPQPVKKRALIKRLAGKWIRTSTPDIVIFSNDGSGQLKNTSTGKTLGSGQLRYPTEEIAEIKWSNGYEWTIRFAGEDEIAITERDHVGNAAGDGAVLMRDAEARKDTAPQPEKPDWIVGHWSEPNCGHAYVYEKDGSCRSVFKVDGRTRMSGSWRMEADGSVVQSDANGWKATIRPIPNQGIEFQWFTPTGNPAERERLLRLK